LARASAFQAEGRGFESRLPLHFFLFELGFPKIRITGRMELCSPAPVYTLPIRLFIPIRTWVPQDSNDEQGGALLPCTSLYSSYSTIYSYSNLGFPRFELRAGWSPFVPIRTWVSQDSNYGGPAPLHQAISFLFELGFPKIRITGRVELCSPAPIYILPIRPFVPIRTWIPQDSNDGQGGASLVCTNLYSSYSTICSYSNLGCPRFARRRACPS
jgi:hypothetical protein